MGKKLREKLRTIVRTILDEFGREINDPTPMTVPLELKRPESLQEQIRRMIKTERMREYLAEGTETFDEANDFEMEDSDPKSMYEIPEMEEEYLAPGHKIAVNQNTPDPAQNEPPIIAGGKTKASGSVKKKAATPDNGSSSGSAEAPPDQT